MASWKVSATFLFVYLCFNGVKSSVVKSADEINVHERVQALEEEILRLKTTQSDIHKGLNERKCYEKTPNIAFRSALSNTLSGMTHGVKVIFSVLEMNNGGAYNLYDGTFTAPYDGVYMFSLKLGNYGAHPGTFTLIQSSWHLIKYLEYVFAGYNSGWDMGGTTTVVQLHKGDKVWVQGEGYAHGRIFFQGYWRDHTTFSGALLYLV